MARTAGHGRRLRLDAELVRRGLARSREHAASLIADGRVRVGGTVASKPATGVETAAAVVVADDLKDPGWASRGASKLLGALDAFPDVTIAGRRCLDAGASTGGFTDVLLRRGAREVVAVDVGYGQLVWSLRTDERVTVLDRTNVRGLGAESMHAVGGPVDVVVADLSFISLRLVLDALLAVAAPGADLLPMVKPQFEVGRERLGSGGVVRDPALRADAVLGVVAAARERGLVLRGATASPLPGPAGNVEYFLWLRHAPAGTQESSGDDEDSGGGRDADVVARAVAAGPS